MLARFLARLCVYYQYHGVIQLYIEGQSQEDQAFLGFLFLYF